MERTRRIVWNAALAGVAALLLIRMRAAFLSTPDRRIPFILSENSITYSGEALLHRMRPDRPNPTVISLHLPFLSVSTAFLFTHHGGVLGYKNAAGLIFIAITGLLLALTYSVTAPLLYALFVFSSRSAMLDFTETAFAFLVLLMTGVLLWRARKPTVRKSFVLGLALGAVFLFRSSLAFFPPVLAFYEWLFLYRRSLRLYWKHLICLCVVPYLFLIPWMHMNWVAYRRVIPFEYVEANCNIVTGALGLVQTIEGDWRALIEDHRIEGRWRGNVYAWAIRQVCRHPFRYAAAYLARLVYAASLNPILLLMALSALWNFRNKNEFRQLGLLAVYFVGVHCLMSVQANYFMPLWPLTAILAGTLVDLFRPRRRDSIQPGLYRLSRNALGACLAVVLGLALTTELVVNSYADRLERDPRAPGAILDGDILRSPDDAWLLFERGRRRLRRGELRGAAADLSRGLAVAPNADAELKLAWTKMLLGEPRSLFDWHKSDDTPAHNQESFIGPILKAHGYSRLGRHEDARRELQAAIDSIRASTFARGRTALELETIEELRRDDLVDERTLMMLRLLLPHRPVKERSDLLADLATLRPGSSVIARALARERGAR